MRSWILNKPFLCLAIHTGGLLLGTWIYLLGGWWQLAGIIVGCVALANVPILADKVRFLEEMLQSSESCRDFELARARAAIQRLVRQKDALLTGCEVARTHLEGAYMDKPGVSTAIDELDYALEAYEDAKEGQG